MRIAAPAESIRTCRAMASGRFGHFKPETEKKNRQADIRKGPALKRILEAWHSIDLDSPSGSLRCGRATIEIYDTVADRLSGINARQTDIDAFITYLKSCELDYYTASKAGLFLSALVNTGCQKSYRLDLRGMAPLDSVAFKNCKRLVVLCDEGGTFASYNSAQVKIRGNIISVASFQTSGKSIVHGNCRDVAFHLNGGEVIVHGTVERVGAMMQDGYVRIKGRVEALVSEECEIGIDMEGGTISADSYDPESIQALHALGGRIYVAGALLYENGTEFFTIFKGRRSWEEILKILKLQRKSGSHL